MAERNEQGWAVELSEFMNFATCQQRGRSVEVSIDPEHVEVQIEEGSGYCAQHCSTYIPIEIIVQLMQAAGYTVTRAG